MPIISSNMTSKQYCSECKGFDISKLHRSFIQKNILSADNKLQCNTCNSIFKPSAFDGNVPKVVPLFLNEYDSVTQSKIIVKPVNVPSDLTSASSHSEQPLPVNSGNQRLVSENFLINKKKTVRLYFVASLLAFFGSAYAFISMPPSSGTDISLLDAGTPAEVVSQNKSGGMSQKAKFSDEPIITIAAEVQDLQVVKKPSVVITKITPDIVSDTFFESSNTKIAANLSKKADKVLSSSFLDNSLYIDIVSTTLLNVPLLKTSVRHTAVSNSYHNNTVQVVAGKSEITDTESVGIKRSTNKSSVIPATDLVNKSAVRTINRDLDRLFSD